jgi:hypothetical protein
MTRIAYLVTSARLDGARRDRAGPVTPALAGMGPSR